MYCDVLFERSVAFLRIAIGIIFFWFGALKLASYNPVYDIVYASFPFHIVSVRSANSNR